ncbi:MAG TPA: hypothetical protein VEZ71_30465 [Archangium sp.]|nr:hypothetical protein [Archangium sp.]
MLRSKVPVAALAVLFLSACTAAREAQLATSIQTLTELQQQRQAELDATTAELDRLRLETKKAEAAAQRSRCEAWVARIDAVIQVRQARCVEQIAGYSACSAKNSARTAKAGFWGCMLGVTAGVLSGGSLAPFALAGCGGGALAGGASVKECGEPPKCTESFEQIQEQVLRAEGLESRPACEFSSDAAP